MNCTGKKMEIYEDFHNKPHYHLGSDQYSEPIGQDKIFKRIIRRLKKQLPKGLDLNFHNEHSVTAIDTR